MADSYIPVIPWLPGRKPSRIRDLQDAYNNARRRARAFDGRTALITEAVNDDPVYGPYSALQAQYDSRHGRPGGNADFQDSSPASDSVGFEALGAEGQEAAPVPGEEDYAQMQLSKYQALQAQYDARRGRPQGMAIASDGIFGDLVKGYKAGASLVEEA